MFTGLADLVEQLERAGELVRVRHEVDAELEIAAITRRVAAEGGPALAFENVRGQRTPVVTNLLGTAPRITRALGVAGIEEFVERVERWLGPSAQASGWLDKLRGGAASARDEAFAPRTVRTGLCQQVVRLGRDVDLGQWPLLRAWPGETRHSITAGQLVSRQAADGALYVETTTFVLLGHDRLGAVGHGHQRWVRSWHEYAANKQRMPVAIVLGGDPALAVAATTTAFDAWELAGVLRGAPLELVKCRTHDLEVPADAEIVIEGFFDSTEPTQPAGMLASETGYYGAAAEAWLLHVTAVTQRTNPMFPATIIAVPPCETSAIRHVAGRLLRPLVAAAIPELVDYNLASCAGPQQFAVVSIRKTYPRQARKVAAAWWGAEALMFTIFLIVVDEHVNIHDSAAVLRAIGANVSPERDVFPWTGPGWPGDCAAGGSGEHLGIDATAKLIGESANPSPARLIESAEIVERIIGRWQEYGL